MHSPYSLGCRHSFAPISRNGVTSQSQRRVAIGQQQPHRCRQSKGLKVVAFLDDVKPQTVALVSVRRNQ